MKNIFISSTFIDMQAERDLVQERVLPALRDEARKYGDNVGVIDLRWGVDTSTLETEEGAAKVLQVCLDEIDRSHPYMLIFLGERYGTMMREDQIEKSVRGREDKYTTDDYVKSITALEVEYGALSEKYGELNHCVVCFREPVVHMLDGAEKDLYAEHTEEGKRKLEVLKERIKRDLGEDDRLITYSCAWDKSARQLVDFTSNGQPLENVLTNCFVEMFRDDWKEYEALSWQDKEQLAFRALMESKLRSFVGREALLEEYYQSAVNGTCPIILQGETGSGKTSIMCKLVERLKKEGKNVFAFFSGAGSMSTNAESLVKQMVYYVENVLGIEEHLGEENEEVEKGENQKISYTDWLEHLHELCSRVQEWDKVYFCIDALDQLYKDEHIEKLDFFMNEKNVQVIASCTDLFDLPAEVFLQRTVRQIPVLSEEDAKVVVRGILSSYSRDAYDAIEKEILRKKSIGNPLYISLLIQRLLMMDQDELRHAMTEEEIVEMGTEIIRNMPDALDDAVVSIIGTAIDKVSDNEEVLQEMINYLAVSRSGLRVQDLQGIFEQEKTTFYVLDFTLLMKYLDSFFYLHEDDRIDFTHKVIRRGLLKAIEGKIEGYNEKTGKYVTELGGEDSLRLSEGMYYARILKNYSLAEELIIKAFEENDKELQKKIKEEALEEEGDFYCHLLARTKKEKIILFFHNCFNDLLDLSQKEIKIGMSVLKEVMKRELDAYNSRKRAEVLRYLCSGWNRMGKFYENLGNQVKAQQNYKQAISKLNELVSMTQSEQDFLVYMETYRNSGNIEKEKGGQENWSEALQMLKESLRYEKEYLEICEEKTAVYPVAESYILLGEVSALMQQGEEAIAHYEAAIGLLSEAGKTEKEAESLRVLADSYRGMGMALSLTDEDEAMVCYEKALENRNRLYEQNRTLRNLRDLAEDYVELSKLNERYGRIKEATEYRKKAMQCQEEIYRQNRNLQSMTALADSYAYFGSIFDMKETEVEDYKEKSAALYYELGELHNNGWGVEKSDEKAFQWYQKSAEQGDVRGQYGLGEMYYNGRGVEESYEMAVEWYQKAIAQGSTDAKKRMALIFVSECIDGVSADQREEWEQEIKERGTAYERTSLGDKYRYGQGVPRDAARAAELYRRAAEDQFGYAQWSLGCMYEEGQGVVQSNETAKEWYEKAVTQGNKEAQRNLGMMYEKGLLGEIDEREAARLYELSAEQGDPWAQYYLGCMYASGKGVKASESRAIELLERAAHAGVTDSNLQFKLGELYDIGKENRRDGGKASAWYQKAVEQNHSSAQCNLALMYMVGNDVGLSARTALELYEKAATQGNVSAMFCMGMLYFSGQGTAINVMRAVDFFQRAAEQEHVNAQFMLSLLYGIGRGVEVNEEEAERWYQKAVKQGRNEKEYDTNMLFRDCINAKENLGLVVAWHDRMSNAEYKEVRCNYAYMYEIGRGVEKSEEEAIKWYQKAAEQGDAIAKMRMKKYSKKSCLQRGFLGRLLKK